MYFSIFHKFVLLSILFLAVLLILHPVHALPYSQESLQNQKLQGVYCQDFEGGTICSDGTTRPKPVAESKYVRKQYRTNDKGEIQDNGSNYIMILNPNDNLEFKVSTGMNHALYQKDANNNYLKEFKGKDFRELLTEDNSKLNGKIPTFGINADFIQSDNKTPMGLNISRGVNYSGGIWDNSQYSFGISKDKNASIQIGLRNLPDENYNIVGGFGLFYSNGVFKDLCKTGGFNGSECGGLTANMKRSLVAITEQNYVIFIVNNNHGRLNNALDTDEVELLLQNISLNNNIGKVTYGLFFDGGGSPGFYYNNNFFVENGNNIGSVFLVYEK